MAPRRTTKLLSHIGPLRRLPLLQLLTLGEIVILAREHTMRLNPTERRRMVELIRRGRGRRRNLTEGERDELAGLIAKANPRQFAGRVAARFSPVPLPGRVVNGKKR